MADGRGEIPIHILNTHTLKDIVWSRIEEYEVENNPEPLSFVIPQWFVEENMTWWFSELTTEQREDVKGWTNPHGRRNEAFDLAYMAEALYRIVGADKIDWGKAPRWAQPHDTNSLVISKDGRRNVKRLSAAELAKLNN